MGRPQSVSDAQIIEAARRLFLEEGPQTSLARIGEHLGLSQPALSQRFGGKASLLALALAPRGDQSWVGALLAGPTEAPLVDQLIPIARGAMDTLVESMPAMFAMRFSGVEGLEQLLEGQQAPHVVVRDAVVHFFTVAVQRALVRRDVDPQRVAFALIGALQARAMIATVERVPLSEPERHQHADAVVSLLLFGAVPRGEA